MSVNAERYTNSEKLEFPRFVITSAMALLVRLLAVCWAWLSKQNFHKGLRNDLFERSGRYDPTRSPGGAMRDPTDPRPIADADLFYEAMVADT